MDNKDIRVITGFQTPDEVQRDQNDAVAKMREDFKDLPIAERLFAAAGANKLLATPYYQGLHDNYDFGPDVPGYKPTDDVINAMPGGRSVPLEFRDKYMRDGKNPTQTQMFINLSQWQQEMAERRANDPIQHAMDISGTLAEGYLLGKGTSALGEGLRAAGASKLVAGAITGAANVGIGAGYPAITAAGAGERTSGEEQLFGAALGGTLGWMDGAFARLKPGSGVAKTAEEAAHESPVADAGISAAEAPKVQPAAAPETAPATSVGAGPEVAPRASPGALEDDHEIPGRDLQAEYEDRQQGHLEDAFQASEGGPKLPPELAKSTPRYAYGANQFNLAFHDDRDLAAFVIGGSGKSAAHDKFVQWASELTGKSEAELRAAGQGIRNDLKSQVKAGAKDTLEVEPTKYWETHEALSKPHVSEPVKDAQNVSSKIADFRNYWRSIPKTATSMLDYVRSEGTALRNEGVKGNFGSMMYSTPEQLGAEIARVKLAKTIDDLKSELKANPGNQSAQVALQEATNKMSAFEKHISKLAITPRKVRTIADTPDVQTGDKAPAELAHETAPEKVRGFPADVRSSVASYNLDGFRYQLNFASDVDKALYIAGLKTSGVDAEAMAFLKKRYPNLSESQLRQYGQQLQQEHVDKLAKSVSTDQRPTFKEAVSFDVPTWNRKMVDPKVPATVKSPTAVAAAALHGDGVEHLEVVPADGIPKDPFSLPKGYDKATWEGAVEQAKFAQAPEVHDSVRAVLAQGGHDIESAHPDLVRQATAHELYARGLASAREALQETSPEALELKGAKYELNYVRNEARKIDPDKDPEAMQRANSKIAELKNQIEQLGEKLKGTISPRMFAVFSATTLGGYLALGTADRADASSMTGGNDIGRLIEAAGGVAAVTAATVAKIMSRGRARIYPGITQRELKAVVGDMKADVNAALQDAKLKGKAAEAYSKAGYAKEKPVEDPVKVQQDFDKSEGYKQMGATRPGVVTVNGELTLPNASKAWAIRDVLFGVKTGTQLRQVQDSLLASSNPETRSLFDAIIGGATFGRKGGRDAKGAGLNPSGATTAQPRLEHTFLSEGNHIDETQYFAWAKEQGKLKVDAAVSQELRRSFQRDVFDEMEGIKTNNEYAAAAAKAQTATLDKIVQTAKDSSEAYGYAGVEGSRADMIGNLEKIPNYVPHALDEPSLRDARARFGDDQIHKAVSESIQKRQPELKAEEADDLAKSWLKGQVMRLYREKPEIQEAAVAADTRKSLEALGLTQDQIANAMAKTELVDDHPVPGFTKNRVNMDIRHTVQLTDKDGSLVDFQLIDLHNTDVRNLVSTYARRASGIIAAAQEGSRGIGLDLSAPQGRALAFNKLMAIDEDPKKVELLQAALNRTLGYGDSDILGRRTDATRFVSQILNAHYGQMFTFAHIPDAGNLAAPEAYGALMQQMGPVFKGILGKAREGAAPEDILRSMSQMGYTGLESAYSVIKDHLGDEMVDKIMRGSEIGLNALMKANLFKQVLALVKHLKGASELQLISDHMQALAGESGFRTINPGYFKHMEPLGMTEEMLAKMQTAFRASATLDRDGVLKYLDMDRFHQLDYDGAERLSDYTFRVGSEAIREKVGLATITPATAGNLGSLATEFLGVVLQGFNRIRRDVQNFDGNVAARWVTSAVFAIPAYIARVSLLYAFDQAQLEEALQPSEIFKAAFRNSTVGAIPAMVGDSVAGVAGYPAPFQRSTVSGRASTVSIPILDALNSGRKAIGDTIRDTTNGDYNWTAPDARNVSKWATPLWWTAPLSSYYLSSLPDKQQSEVLRQQKAEERRKQHGF